MSGMESLEDLMHDELKDIYDAEKQLTKALPKLAKKASNDQLRQAIEQHLQETQGHVERLEQIFEQLGMPARGKKCDAMKHLIEEGNDMIAEADEEAVRDAVMIASAQKVEHYEIASYGTLRTWANMLEKNDAAALLEETLEEEKEADMKLTSAVLWWAANASSHSARLRVRSTSWMRATRSERRWRRTRLSAWPGSSSQSVRPVTWQNREKVRSLASPRVIGWSAVSNAW